MLQQWKRSWPEARDLGPAFVPTSRMYTASASTASLAGCLWWAPRMRSARCSPLRRTTSDELQ
ncbi:hypothetical protein WME73_30840 [Sorangium sp. So ce302]|uniref:hypothetical protein n=1 Tax=Sorangium sp. So ce302 TaxID=3133297 RepID=UPI003F61CD8F